MEYRVDIQDVKFQLFEWLELAKLLDEERFGNWDPDSVEMVLNEALKIAQEKVAPSNEDGDRIGVTLEEGRVQVPASFGPAYRTIAEGGWIGCLKS